jgi:large subunit ribosomal protein L9
MRVILKEDLKIGRIGAVVTVKNGYARNYLIPQNKAVKCTQHNQAHFETIKKDLEAKALIRKNEAQAQAEKLKDIKLTILARVVSAEKLFGAITLHQVMQALAAQNITCSKNQIHIETVIRHTGNYHIQITLHPEVCLMIPLTVAAENPQERFDRYAPTHKTQSPEHNEDQAKAADAKEANEEQAKAADAKEANEEQAKAADAKPIEKTNEAQTDDAS